MTSSHHESPAVVPNAWLAQAASFQAELCCCVYGSHIESGEELCQIFDTAVPNSRIGVAATHLPGGCRLLDLGCGYGHLLYASSKKYRELHGVDFVLGELRAAHRWAAHKGIPLRTAAINLNVGELPYATATFDAVTAIAILEFVMAPERILSEIARVLTPGGMAIVSVGNAVSYRNRARVLFGHELRTTTCQAGVNGGVLHFFNLKMMRQLVESVGMGILSVGCSGRWHKLRSWWPSLLGGDLLIVMRRGVL